MSGKSQRGTGGSSQFTRREVLGRGALFGAGLIPMSAFCRSLEGSEKPAVMNVRILDAAVEFFERDLNPPLRLSSGVITQVTEARVEVTAAAGDRRGTGRGSIYLSDLWSWPDPTIPHVRRDAALRKLCQQIATNLKDLCGNEPAHPLELGLRLHTAITRENEPPVLARALCASPFDAAIHDAVGQALSCSAFAFYGDAFPVPSADGEFAGSVCRAIAGILREPVRQLKAWWVVGSRDDLPALVAPAVARGGYGCFKLKIAGKDAAADAARTIEVYRFVKQLGVADPELIVDSNEGNPDAESALTYLKEVQRGDAAAFAALKYLEQPTGRDIETAAYDWSAVTRLKPVVLDEGLIHPRLGTFELFDLARRQGWSGFALKTCKGHSFALTAAAWARQHGMQLTLQDLTNPGLAAIHAALLAAHVPFANEVEINSPQFTASANGEWLPRLSGLFEPRDGVHRLDFAIPDGLGSTL